MTTVAISLEQLQLFLLVFARLGAIISFLPVFNSTAIPILFKAGLAFAASFALFPILDLPPGPDVVAPLALAAGVGAEILLGIMIGFTLRVVLAGIQMAGQLAGFQMGLAIAEVMDPSTSEQVPLLAQFNNLLALMLLLVINAHHWFIQTLVESFTLLPPLGMNMPAEGLRDLAYLAGNMFVIAIKIGAPVVVALLLTSVAFGLLARTVPQMNVFIVAMPLKILVGLVFFGFSLPFLAPFIARLFSEAAAQILAMTKAMV